MFQYGLCDSNKMPLVPDDFRTRTKLKMTGSETLLFVRLFGYLVGDKIPRDDLFCPLYLKLRDLLDVCHAKSLPSTCSISLKVIFEEFNTMYVQVTGDLLKAKMHFGLHYGTFGPSSQVDVDDFENLDFVKDLPKNVTLETCSSPNWINFKGTKYQPGMVLLISVNESGGPVFGMLEVILVSFDNTVVFVYSDLVTIGFDEQLHSYEVENYDNWSCTTPSDLVEPLPLSLYTSVNGKKTVILRHLL
ncbi:Methylthioribose-1-phosphate isomerase [Frankliniella fusca]|uniref:Methylthioribose-1-phosphate isomerase n=1 Tax=Frankliniella fusca TaxID=407009 RepID=A0AAE1HQK6_9NEOP|nr:Methylthioribose-1-phosphate isomerase [Frankliniella fusca]